MKSQRPLDFVQAFFGFPRCEGCHAQQREEFRILVLFIQTFQKSNGFFRIVSLVLVGGRILGIGWEAPSATWPPCRLSAASKLPWLQPMAPEKQTPAFCTG